MIVAIAAVDAIKGLLRCSMRTIHILSYSVQLVASSVHATCLIWENQSVQVVDQLPVPIAKPEQEELFELTLVKAVVSLVATAVGPLVKCTVKASIVGSIDSQELILRDAIVVETT